MSRLKISEELFLEQQELNRLLRFIQIDGIKQNLLSNTQSFGILEGYNNPLGLNIIKEKTFRVEVNSSNTSVNVLPGIAIDKNSDIIYSNYTRTIDIPSNNLWYWVKIKYNAINEEIGTCSIDSNGNVIGANTKFTEIFRGEPNYPNKIKFTNATSNVSEYEILDVINDTNLKLIGNFSNESNLKFACIGTFTSGFNPNISDKFIYEYDDVEISLVQETTTNTKPNNSQDLEFYIARARLNSSVIELQDKRTEFYKTVASYNIENITRLSNPIIGVETVKWDLETTPRDKNEVSVAWGYRSTNWSINTAQNLVTINSGLGGILKENDLSQFTNGFFNNWRLYTKSGKYYKVVSSIKQGSQLNIKLDVLIDTEFNTGDEIIIVPDCEEIEIKTRYDGNNINTIIEEVFSFPINLSTGKLFLKILSATNNTLYNLTYRYKTTNNYTDYFSFANDSIGYYSETSFNLNGTIKPNIIDRVQKPYLGSFTSGFVELVPNPRNLNIILDEIVTGDKFGVDNKSVNNSNTVYDLVVGRDRIVQLLNFNSITVANDIFINLNKLRIDGTSVINGNKFLLQLFGTINLNGRNIRIVTDYVNPGSYTLIRQLSQEDVDFINANQFTISTGKSGLTYLFNYDGSLWRLNNSNENYITAINSLTNSIATLDANLLIEITNRTLADTTLQNQIDDEVYNRGQADIALSDKIDTKANRDQFSGSGPDLINPNLINGWRGALGLGQQILRAGQLELQMGPSSVNPSWIPYGSQKVSTNINAIFSPALPYLPNSWEFTIYMMFANSNNTLMTAPSLFGGGAHNLDFIINYNDMNATGFDFRIVDNSPPGLNLTGATSQIAGRIQWIMVAKNREWTPNL